ncbi:MAG: hypothetical protein JXA90_08490, partial [Planctomycetes bacterium]|nr:hypothetical protein [Planctomycetota bacterium]
MMDRRGCCAREPGGEVRRARGKRIRDGGIIFCASLLLALLGVPWGVPLALVVFGAALLLAMAMAALFERGSPGAL